MMMASLTLLFLEITLFWNTKKWPFPIFLGPASPFLRPSLDEFPNLKKFASRVVSMFGTYVCEQTFSKMKYVNLEIEQD